MRNLDNHNPDSGPRYDSLPTGPQRLVLNIESQNEWIEGTGEELCRRARAHGDGSTLLSEEETVSLGFTDPNAQRVIFGPGSTAFFYKDREGKKSDKPERSPDYALLQDNEKQASLRRHKKDGGRVIAIVQMYPNGLSGISTTRSLPRLAPGNAFIN